MSGARDRLAVIVVDDEPSVLQAVRLQLRDLGDPDAALELAESGEEAIELLDELAAEGVAVPVVIADQLMPGMKGEIVLAKAFERDPRTHTIMLTGRASSDAVGAAVNTANLYRFVAKPWDGADLLLTVRAALDSWKAARAVEVRERALDRAHRASLRFVPARLLEHLNRAHVSEVHPGDRTDVNVSVLFFGARRPELLADSGSSFFSGLVAWLDRAVHDAGGFIYDVSGCAPLAFFPDDADGALDVALRWQHRLAEVNAERDGAGEAPFEANVGGCCGPVLLRIHGGDRRLFCGALGDAINTAARVQAATSELGASVLVTADLPERLRRPEAFDLRPAGRVQLKGKATTTALVEVRGAET